MAERPPFRRILVANRGEIAVRVMRSAKELGCETVAVYSDVDRDALHVRFADTAYHLGGAAPSQSYLNADKVLEIAARAGADAIHPGYGFFAENAAFARRVIAAGITWIGPHPDAIDAMGDKVRARRTMIAAGVPVVPGGTEPIADLAAARLAAEAYGLPLALKASGGGGGKGLKVARSLDEVESAFTTAGREATAYFGNGTIYAERYLENPKHIELQILADKHGTVLHVGERDCSLQRRHQKLWEEAPPNISVGVRDGLRAAGVQAAQAIGYDSVGTIECLVSGDAFYFLEMNTRIQVEHTVSEQISGIDLVREQILVAAGRPLALRQDDVALRGHAIEVRINAEDPAQNFRPAPGTVTRYREPGGFGVRVDSAAYPGFAISPEYDSLIAKLIVTGRDRDEALARLRRAIAEYEIAGVPTTLPLLRALIDFGPVREATYGTATLEPFAATLGTAANGTVAPPRHAEPSLRHAEPVEAEVEASDDTIRVEVNDQLFRVRFVDLPLPPGTPRPAALKLSPKKPANERKNAAAAGNDVVAPMHGVVVEIPVAAGAIVAEGDVVAVIEAMKMMNEIRTHQAGTVAAVYVAPGTTVEARTPLLTLQ
jgi:acetyl-CoA/propionyl-CoA carboxylase, biotin carboxylase, biotin carboxyl carrier protein